MKGCESGLLSIKNIKVGGAKNVRDLGGMPVSGGTVKPHMLIRSSHINKISDSGVRVLKSLGVKTVIDLRNHFEKGEKPDKVIDGFNYLECPVFDSSIPGISHESKRDLNNVPVMTELYADVANGDSFKNLCRTVSRIITASEDEFAILYHCTEGKDRTGMVTALILYLLGAKREDIVEEYLYTNTVNRKKARGLYILVRVLKNNKVAAGRVYNVFLAKEEYINEIFKVIDKIGYEKLLSDYLCLTEKDIEKFKNKAVKKDG